MRNNQILIVLISAGLLASAEAGAGESEQLIAECSPLSDRLRIACLEEAIRQLSGDPPEPVVETVEAEPPPAPEQAQPAQAPNPERTAVSAMETPATTVSDRSTPASEATAPTAQEPAVVLGEEQVARRNDKEQQDTARISARIVEHRLVGTGRLRLTLDNGQVWQQTEDDRDRIARRIRNSNDIAVEMWQSRSGGYRMHLVDINRTLRVQRIR